MNSQNESMAEITFNSDEFDEQRRVQLNLRKKCEDRYISHKFESVVFDEIWRFANNNNSNQDEIIKTYKNLETLIDVIVFNTKLINSQKL